MTNSHNSSLKQLSTTQGVRQAWRLSVTSHFSSITQIPVGCHYNIISGLITHTNTTMQPRTIRITHLAEKSEIQGRL